MIRHAFPKSLSKDVHSVGQVLKLALLSGRGVLSKALTDHSKESVLEAIREVLFETKVRRDVWIKNHPSK